MMALQKYEIALSVSNNMTQLMTHLESSRVWIIQMIIDVPLSFWAQNRSQSHSIPKQKMMQLNVS